MEDDSVIRVNARIAIPLRELELHYVRAAGPGGQNVNKVATKAVLRFDVQGSPSIPEPGRTRALAFLASRLTRDGALVLTSAIHRSQLRNREAVIERLRQLLAEAVVVPKRRRPTKPSSAARERRLTEKKARGRLKRERGELD